MLPTAARMTARRPFSVLARVRSIAHNPQIGHVQGYPASHQGAKADWGRQFRHLGSSAMFFFPGMAFILGWPLLAEKVLDGHM